MRKMNMKASKSITYIFLVISIILPLLLYDGAIDSFAPLHVVPIDEIVHFGFINMGSNSEVPCFYIIGSIISLVAGIQAKTLIYLPIQLFPSILVFFILFRKISGNSLFASVLTLTYSISDITGNKIFFWVHGLGLILFIMILFLIANKLDNRFKQKNTILFIISITALVYISYDLTFQLIIILTSIILLLIIKQEYAHIIKSFTTILLVLMIIQLGLSKFVYNTLIPEFMQSENAGDPIEAFISTLFGGGSITDIAFSVTDPYIIYPNIIGVIGGAKYTILMSSIVIAFVFILRKFIHTKKVDSSSVLLIAFFISSTSYIVAKLPIGQFPIGVYSFPGIMALSFLYKISNNRISHKFILSFAISILFTLSSINYIMMDTNNFINKDENHFEYVEPSVNWYWKYCEGMVVSDILTNNLFYMGGSKISISNGGDLKSVHDYFRALDPFYDLPSMLNISSNKYDSIGQFYIINKRLNKLDVERWKVLKPWNYFMDEIEMNSNYNLIYTTEDMMILY